MTELINKSRLLWSCRRGMLELDLLFMPFVNEAFDQLQDAEKITFQRLLTCGDPDLFTWFMGGKACPDLELQKMIDVIRQYVKA